MCLVTPLHLLHTYRDAVRAARIRPALDQWTRAGQGQRGRASRHRDLRWRHLLQSRRVLVPRARIAYRCADTITDRTRQAARRRLRAACIRLQAVLIRLQVPRLSVLRAATRAARLDGRRRRGEDAAGTRLLLYSPGSSTGRKSGFMTWRLLHLPDRASSPLLLTMPAARHVGLHRARDHRDPRVRLCGRHGRYGRPRAA